MDHDGLLGAVPNVNKRTFVEALKEFTSTQTPAAKRISIDPNSTDIIRIEVNKVLFPFCYLNCFWKYIHRFSWSVLTGL
jgi:hypothetical protein